MPDALAAPVMRGIEQEMCCDCYAETTQDFVEAADKLLIKMTKFHIAGTLTGYEALDALAEYNRARGKLGN